MNWTFFSNKVCEIFHRTIITSYNNIKKKEGKSLVCYVDLPCIILVIVLTIQCKFWTDYKDCKITCCNLLNLPRQIIQLVNKISHFKISKQVKYWLNSISNKKKQLIHFLFYLYYFIIFYIGKIWCQELGMQTYFCFF